MSLKLISPHVVLRRLARPSPTFLPMVQSNKLFFRKFVTISPLLQQRPPVEKRQYGLSDGHESELSKQLPNAYQKDLESQGTAPAANIKSEKILNIPNILTFTRLAAAPFIGYYIVKGESTIAMSLFIYSCLTDFVDGYIARKYNQMSVMGSIIDPMADKLLMTVCTVCLAVSHSMPIYVAGVIVGRDVMLSFMGFYYRYISLPPPKTFRRYVDISIPTVSVHPSTLSKINTLLQMVYIGSIVLQPGIESLLGEAQYLEYFHFYLQYFGVLVSTTSILSGASYLFSSKAVKILK